MMTTRARHTARMPMNMNTSPAGLRTCCHPINLKCFESLGLPKESLSTTDISLRNLQNHEFQSVESEGTMLSDDFRGGSSSFDACARKERH